MTEAEGFATWGSGAATEGGGDVGLVVVVRTGAGASERSVDDEAGRTDVGAAEFASGLSSRAGCGVGLPLVDRGAATGSAERVTVPFRLKF